jgi:hypothetical protein
MEHRDENDSHPDGAWEGAGLLWFLGSDQTCLIVIRYPGHVQALDITELFLGGSLEWWVLIPWVYSERT